MMRAIYRQIKMHKLALLAGLLLAGVVLWSPTPVHASTTCPTDTSRGTSSGTFTAPLTTNYRVYVRMMASSSANNTFALEVDGTCYNMGGTNIGGAALPVYSNTVDWTSSSDTSATDSDWVDSELNSTTPVDINLASGSHTYEMIGNADNVRVDRVVFTQESGSSTCVPVYTGDNCASGTITVPPVSIPFYLQSGGTGYNDSTDKINWSGDEDFTQTNAEGQDGTATNSKTGGDGTTCTEAVSIPQNENCTGHAITIPASDTIGPKDQGAYQTERWGNFNYDIPVPDATYNVILNFAEINPATSNGGSRIINVTSSNAITSSNTTGALLTNYNLTNVAPAGYVADSHEFTIPVTNGILDLEFTEAAGSSNNAKLSSLEILPYTTTTSCTNTPGTPKVQSSTDTSITLSWTAGASTSGCTPTAYNIYRSDISSTTPYKSNVTGTSFTDSGLTPSTLYTYSIQTVNSSTGNSPIGTSAGLATMADTTPPTFTGPVTATAKSAGEVDLTWSPGSDDIGVVGYDVYRNNSSTPLATSTTVTGTTYKDTTVAANTSYTYQVVAVDGAGNLSTPKVSSNSVTTPTSTDTTPPTAPTALKNSVLASQSAQFTWTASTDNTGVSGYHVYLKYGGTDVYLGDSPTADPTSFTASCLEPGVAYTFDFKAYDAAGNVSPAASMAITTPTSTGVYAGDVNCDQKVDYPDLLTETLNWGKTDQLPNQGDVNGDGTVSYIDLLTTTINWGKSW
jgi:fibronectin type 3 domain-containing protein